MSITAQTATNATRTVAAAASASALRLVLAGLVSISLGGIAALGGDEGSHSEYRVKYVAAGAVYLEGGRNVGLAEGVKLWVKRTKPVPTDAGKGQPGAPEVIGQIRVTSVAQVSAVCEVISTKAEIQVGDIAYLEEQDAEALAEQSVLGGTREYPQVVTFTEGDPLDEEIRASLPRPPSPEVNRARGRIGFEYGGLQSCGAFASNTTQLGLVLRADITRIGGTYWNLSGYWRGRLDSQSASPAQQSLNDLINRTYHMSLDYANPNSRWVAGFGRLYLPWASSLDTIDGGYVGRRVSDTTTVGLFAGSTPDPSSWDYSPNRHLAGTFVNFQGGSFDSTRYTSTVGVGISTVGWQAKRPFLFVENGIFYKRYLSIYQSVQIDRPSIQLPGARPTTALGLGRSFVTVTIQPTTRLSFNINHNYFRDYPTFDPNLISTGLVDKLLFQGLSAGVRFDITRNLSVYNNLGRSTRTGDSHSSWNQLYGLTVNQIWRTGVRGDVRYSTFNSTYGSGNYTAFSLSRNLGESLHWEVIAGQQDFVSPYSKDTRYRNLGFNLDWSPGSRFFLDSGFTRQNGNLQSYTQWYVGLGYRFDSLRHPRSAKTAK
jgi:hypothetical protein